MSRCFPYPPPGFERSNGAPNEALIESIKLLRESEKTRKERRKEKKREKKEKKEKNKEKSRAVGEVEKKEHSRKKRRKDEGCNVDHNGVNHPKRREDETEQLEKSSLTEEDGQPAGTMNLYDTSDSSKKIKHSLPDGIHNQWPMLRIRLPLLKHNDSKVPISEEQRPCSTFERNKTIVQMKAPAIAPRPSKEQQPLSTTSGRMEIPVQDRVEPAVRSSFFESGSLKVVDSKFRDLIENWVPPPIQVEHTDFDDQEWLFDMPPHSGEAKNIKANSGASSHVNLSLWPRAYYLPEADIYALPYTVPY